MNKKGYIGVIALIMILIISILIIQLINISFNKKENIHSKRDNLSSYLDARDKIYLLLYDEKYNKILEENISKNLNSDHYSNYSIYLDEYSSGSNENRLRWRFLFKNIGRLKANQILITSNSNKNNNKTKLEAKVDIINKFFIQEKDIFLNELDKENKELLKDLFYIVFNGDITGNYFDKYKFYEYNDYNNIITNEDIDENIENIFIKSTGNLILAESISDENSEDDLLNNFNTNYKGIILVDGDLYIDLNLNFNGIIIVSGLIEIGENTFLNNKGIIISRDIVGNYKSEYNPNIIYRHGPFIPGFIQFNVKHIKTR